MGGSSSSGGGTTPFFCGGSCGGRRVTGGSSGGFWYCACRVLISSSTLCRGLTYPSCLFCSRMLSIRSCNACPCRGLSGCFLGSSVLISSVLIVYSSGPVFMVIFALAV